jgi:hypothetical protein
MKKLLFFVGTIILLTGGILLGSCDTGGGDNLGYNTKVRITNYGTYPIIYVKIEDTGDPGNPELKILDDPCNITTGNSKEYVFRIHHHTNTITVRDSNGKTDDLGAFLVEGDVDVYEWDGETLAHIHD